ncbi:MAG: virulence RhuM family protein [Kiritimatiellae bacterium]|nr:virulence RhuM family protein [Kiritimatiellia bacterium]
MSKKLIRNSTVEFLAFMGLTSWENSPDGNFFKSDVSIAKNYLVQDELSSLGTWT